MMSQPVHLLYSYIEGLKILTAFFNSHLAQDTYHALLTVALLLVRPRIKEYSLMLGSTWRERLDSSTSNHFLHASPSHFMKSDMSLTAFQVGKEVKSVTPFVLPLTKAIMNVLGFQDLTIFVSPGVLSGLNAHVATTSNHLVKPHIFFGPQSPGLVIPNLWVALVILSGFLFILLQRFITISTAPRVKAHVQSDRGGGNGRSGTTFNSNSGSNSGQNDQFRSDNDNASASNAGLTSGSGSGSRRGPNPPPPSSSDASGIPPTLLSILDGTYMSHYFGSGGPPPPPPPPGGNSVLDDPSDSESEYESDIWRHPHRLRFGARPRVKARDKHRKNNKHRDAVDNLMNTDRNINPNQNIEIEIPPGLILSPNVRPSEMEMEKQERMRDLIRFVSWCAGISGVSGLIRVVWPPATNTTLSSELDVSLHDVLDGEAHLVVGNPRSSPSNVNLEAIREAGNLASQTAATASWAFVNRSLDLPSGISAYDFDLAVDLDLSFESDVDLGSERSANAIAAMLELMQRLLWNDGHESNDSASDMTPDLDWVDLNLAKAPLSLSLGSVVEDESCARDGNSGVILCLSSTSSSSSSSQSFTTIVSPSSRPSSFSISAEARLTDHFIGSGASPGVCPNVPSFYKGCETYAALLDLQPPTKTVPRLTSVGVGVQNPFIRRLGMFGIRSQSVYEYSTASQSSSSAVHSTIFLSPSLSKSRVSANPSPKMIEPVASSHNLKSQPKPDNSGPRPSTTHVGQSLPPEGSKPQISFIAFNAICAVLNITYALFHSSWAIFPLSLIICIGIYACIGLQATAKAEGAVTTSDEAEDLNMMDESAGVNIVLNTPITVYDPKHTPVKITPSKIPVSITRVDVRDVLRRLDMMYENGDTTMCSSDSSSWSSSSASSDTNIGNFTV